jgi:hypothetical protein
MKGYSYLTPADKGVDAQPDLVGRKRLHDEHVEIKTYICGERSRMRIHTADRPYAIFLSFFKKTKK